MSKAGATNEATALVSARSKQSRLHSYNVDPARNRPPMKCTKCGLDNHTIKGCYEIIGYPEYGFTKGARGIQTEHHLHLPNLLTRLH